MPYWRLSSFYFFYFASLGALVFYWNPYLESLGFSDAHIGELMALIMATRIIAPNLWGWLADRYGQRMRIVRIGSFLCLLTFIGVFFGSTYLWLAIVMTAFSFFWNASLPQFEATTLNHLGEHTARYNMIRIWGSVGFIVTVTVMGFIFDVLPYSILPWVLAALFFLIWFSSLWVPADQVDLEHHARGPIWSIIRRREVLFLLIVVCLLQASHGPYYIYFVRYLKQYGYSHHMTGWLIAIGVIAEIIVFLYMPRWLERYGARRLFLAALLLTVLRWLLTAALAHSLTAMILTQTLHAASFGIAHVVSIYLVHSYFTGRHQGQGQALYSSLSFGVGGALGSLYSGYLWEGFKTGGQVSVLYYTAAVISMLAFVLAWYGLEKTGHRHK